MHPLLICLFSLWFFFFMRTSFQLFEIMLLSFIFFLIYFETGQQVCVFLTQLVLQAATQIFWQGAIQ